MICQICGWNDQMKQLLDMEDDDVIAREVIMNNLLSIKHKGVCQEDLTARHAYYHAGDKPNPSEEK